MTIITIRTQLFILWGMLLILAGCGEQQAPHGSATFMLQWEKPAALGKTVAAATADICSDYGIQTITARFVDSSGVARASGSFACSAHQGTVTGIPAASNYTVTMEGLLAAGATVGWRGEKTGVSIAANVNNPIGAVAMAYVASDTTPPAITAATPATGSSNVAVTSAVSVTFSEAMAASTITDATISLAISGGTAVSGSVRYDQTSKTATFTPAAPLAGSTQYTLTVSTGVKDMSGKGVAAPYSATFTTEAAATATLKLTTQGTVAAGAIKGVEVTVTLPAGVTVMADADGITGSGVVTTSGVVPAGASVVARYIAAAGATAGRVIISIAGSTGFGSGECATLSLSVAAGVTPVSSAFTVSDFTAFDGYGAAISGVSATVALP